MENDKDIIDNHKKMMNDNYYYEKHNPSNNNILKPYYIVSKNNPNKIIDLNEFYKIQYDKDNYIYIKKNFIKWYGGFFKEYEFIQNEQKSYYQNTKTKSILEENPFLILSSLIDNGINPILIPKTINTDENNKNFIKIIFDNSITFLINKETKEIKDLSKNYEEEEEIDSYNKKENEINNDAKEEMFGLNNEIMKEANYKLNSINNDKLMEINQNLEIAKLEKKEKFDNETLFKDLLKEKNIKEDGIFEKDIFKIKFDQRYNLIPSLLEKEKLYKEYISELKANSKEKKGEMKILRKNINKYKLFLKEKIEKNDFDLEMNYIDFYDKYYDNEIVTNVPEQHRELIFNETKFKLKEIYENTKQEIREKYLAFIEKEFPPDKVRLITTIDHIKNVLKLKKEYLSVSSKTERNEIIKEYLDKVKNFIKNRNEHIEQKKKEEEEKKKLEEQNKDLNVKKKYQNNKGILNKDKKESITKNIPLKYTTIKDLDYNNHILIFKKFLNEKIKRRIPYEDAIQLFVKEYGKESLNNLEEEILQKIYKVYIGNLVMKQKDEFNQLLNEYIQYNVDIPWGEAQRMMQYDMRYQNIMPSEREGMYREYRDNIYNRVLSQFETLVNEREDLITKDIPLEGYEYNKILINLRNDPRAQRIERYPDKRDKIIRAKVKELRHKFWDEEKKKQTQLLNKKTERERNAKLYKKWQKGNVVQ